jgi:hypothetical protein
VKFLNQVNMKVLFNYMTVISTTVISPLKKKEHLNILNILFRAFIIKNNLLLIKTVNKFRHVTCIHYQCAAIKIYMLSNTLY